MGLWSRVRSPPVPVVLSVYQRGSLLDGLAMYLSCDMTMKAHKYYIIFGRPPIGGKLPPSPPGGATSFLYTRLWDGRTDRHRPSLYALRYGRGQRKALFKARELN